MERLAIPVGKIIPFVIQYEINHGSIRKRCRLVQDEAAVLNACSQAIHTLESTAF